jgi:hypothetical protein
MADLFQGRSKCIIMHGRRNIITSCGEKPDIVVTRLIGHSSRQFTIHNKHNTAIRTPRGCENTLDFEFDSGARFATFECKHTSELDKLFEESM